MRCDARGDRDVRVSVVVRAGAGAGRGSARAALARRTREPGLIAGPQGLLGGASWAWRVSARRRCADAAMGARAVSVPHVADRPVSAARTLQARRRPRLLQRAWVRDRRRSRLSERVYLLNIAGPHSWRVIYTDGRPHPTGAALRPSFFGHSVGRWEGDTLVIDSVGFNEKQWLAGSYPTTEQLHLVERISRPNLKTLIYEATIDDPGAYTAPWTVRWQINEKTASSWIEGGEIFEYICQDDRDD